MTNAILVPLDYSFGPLAGRFNAYGRLARHVQLCPELWTGSGWRTQRASPLPPWLGFRNDVVLLQFPARCRPHTHPTIAPNIAAVGEPRGIGATNDIAKKPRAAAEIPEARRDELPVRNIGIRTGITVAAPNRINPTIPVFAVAHR